MLDKLEILSNGIKDQPERKLFLSFNDGKKVWFFDCLGYIVDDCISVRWDKSSLLNPDKAQAFKEKA